MTTAIDSKRYIGMRIKKRNGNADGKTPIDVREKLDGKTGGHEKKTARLLFAKKFIYNYLIKIARCLIGVPGSIRPIRDHTRTV